MDFREYDDKINCIQTLIKELGFPAFDKENLIYSYNFFHQIHLSDKNKPKYKREPCNVSWRSFMFTTLIFPIP